MDAYDACFESPYSLYVNANHVRRQLWRLQIPDAVRYQLWERYLMWNKHPAGAPAKPQGKSGEEELGCFWKLVGVSFAICLVGLMVWMFIRVLRWFWDTPLFGGY